MQIERFIRWNFASRDRRLTPRAANSLKLALCTRSGGQCWPLSHPQVAVTRRWTVA